MNSLLRSLKILVLRVGASIPERFLGGNRSKPDPSKPIIVEWYLAHPGGRGQRLFIFLPGRRDRASDFVRHGFITMTQSRIQSLDCVAVDATIGYYLDASVATRLQAEIIEPARRLGYREIWLVGVSMGGLGALFHEREYPGEANGLILLAPFLGNDLKLFAEIDAAGGAIPWARGQPAAETAPNAGDFQRELWRFLGRMQTDQQSQLQIWLAYGDADRLVPGIERLKAILPAERVLKLKGGHTWEVWTSGFEEILAKIDWPADTPI
ncbi:MAG: alpha/beta hydrolase [Verrucomicrobia bacterium]|nr:alpha/beta hydrolase [Verrucomicrobiota bacterium]